MTRLQKTATMLAHFFSFVFSPLLLPTYGMCLALWCSMLIFLPIGVKWRLVGLIFALTAALPALVIAVMKYTGHVSDFGLNNRYDRPVPYCVVCLSYLVSAWILRSTGFPSWLAMFLCGASLATFISLVVNNWWKISAHMAAIGGLLALMLRMVESHHAIGHPLAVTLAIVAVAGVVGSSRVWLSRHTLGQVVAGFMNGLVCVYFVSGL